MKHIWGQQRSLSAPEEVRVSSGQQVLTWAGPVWRLTAGEAGGLWAQEVSQPRQDLGEGTGLPFSHPLTWEGWEETLILQDC